MTLTWQFDAFFWMTLSIGALEGVRVVRSELARQRRSLRAALGLGAVEITLLGVVAATGSPLLSSARSTVVFTREGGAWLRGVTRALAVTGAMVSLAVVGHVQSFAEVLSADLSATWRLLIVGALCLACVAAIAPVRLVDEPKETLAAPLVLTAFARVALPLSGSMPGLDLVVPVVAAVLALVCALWLLSAGMRANHFEPATLVSELVLCERGVLLSFVWMGLSTHDTQHLAGVGSLMAWWSAALALIALESSLRRRPLPKSKAFFSLAMVVGLPGTAGFVGEDLMAQGLLELRPALAAAFVVVSAINAAALYLALVNVIVDLGPSSEPEARPSPMMLAAAAISLIMGLVPQPFVSVAVHAYAAVAQTGTSAQAASER